jgi:hypothetical protein
MDKLTITLVRAVGTGFTKPVEKPFGKVLYACEPGPQNSIYITLRRPSYRTSVDYPGIGAGLKVTMISGLPLSKKMSIEFCGPQVDKYVAELAGLPHISGMPRVLRPILVDELNKLQIV